MPDLYILDVKKGNSAVIIDTLGNIVIDAGKGLYLLEFLIEKNITVIDSLLLSHADDDHIAGAIRLLQYQKIQIKKVYVNQDMEKQTKTWVRLLYALDTNDRNENNESILEVGLTSNLTGKLNKGDVHIEIVAPQPAFVATGVNYQNRKATSNSISAVIRLIYNNKAVALLMGDIDEIGFENILNRNIEIDAWLLVFPHHGGHAGKDIKGFTTKICQTVRPEKIIFSIGNNSNKFPLKEVIETISLALQNANMYTTNYSEIFETHIRQYPDLHKNNVGHIHFNFSQISFELEFIKAY